MDRLSLAQHQPEARLKHASCDWQRNRVVARAGMHGRPPRHPQDPRTRRGEAHVIRNAGGVATDDAVRSLVISQRLLGTDEIILIHHTDCGMLTFKDDEVKTKIESEVGIRPAFALEAFANLADDVRQSIARIHASPFIPNKTSVRGFVYDVRTGRLNEVSIAAGVR